MLALGSTPRSRKSEVRRELKRRDAESRRAGRPKPETRSPKQIPIAENGRMEKRGAALPTTKSAKNAKRGTWEWEVFRPVGDRTSVSNSPILFAFYAFSVVKRLRLVLSVVLLFSAFLRVPLRLCVKSLLDVMNRQMPRNTEEQLIFQRAGQLLTAGLEGIRLGQHTLEAGNLTVKPLLAAQQFIVGAAHRQPQVFRQHRAKDNTGSPGWEDLTQRAAEPEIRSPKRTP